MKALLCAAGLALVASLTAVAVPSIEAVGFQAVAMAQEAAPAAPLAGEGGFIGKVIGFFSGMSLGDWVQAITGVVTAATAITALTPTTADDKALNMLLKVLNFLAGNFWGNRNADAGG